MTNLEYVRTLSKEDMAELIINPELFIPKEYIKGYTSTVYGIERWLEKERKETE